MIDKDIQERLFARRRFGIKLGLDMMDAILKRLGDPQLEFGVVHIAGTNGKGSVCAMIDSIIRAAGIRAGLYTSPHLVEINERIKVDGKNIDDTELRNLILDVEDAAEHAAAIMGRDATFFEFITAVAFEHFKRKGVQIAVVETGMGGRYDATNVVFPLVSVITRISLEHMEYLGKDIKSIAMEKSGIMKEGRPVVCGAMDSESLDVIKQKAESLNSDMYYSPENVSISLRSKDISGQDVTVESMSKSYGLIHLPMLGSHQLENLATALTAVEVLGRTTGLDWTSDIVKRGLSAVDWPARFQVLKLDPPVILDVAHNPGAASALVKSLKYHLGNMPIGLITGMCDDKDVAGFMNEFGGVVNRFWAVPLNNVRGIPVDRLAASAVLMGWDVKESTLDEAVDEAIIWAESCRGAVCIAGSLFLAGEVLGDIRWKDL